MVIEQSWLPAIREVANSNIRAQSHEIQPAALASHHQFASTA